jgi:hypothetical protein
VEGCSCQVKAGNPGIDLLMAIDWFAGLDGPLDVVTPLAGASLARDPTGAESDLLAESSETGSSRTLLRNSLLGLGLGLGVVAIAAWFLIGRSRAACGPDAR